MFKLTRLATIVCLMALARPGISAVNSTASLANPLGNAGSSARALSMGSAFVGVADDSSSLFWNPAGLGGLKTMEAALHHNSWLAGILQETAVVAFPVEHLGSFGASITYVSYGTLAAYDENANQLADYSVNRYGGSAGWGMVIMPDISVGATLKGSMQTIEDKSYADVSVDLGGLWTPMPDLRLGIAYTNLGASVVGYSLASALRVGGSYLLHLAPTNHLRLAASAAWEPQGVSRLQVGLEDLLFKYLALRLGYQANLADSQIQGLTGLTAGIGGSYEGASLDYAFLPYGDLGITHRISLSYKFGS